MKVDFKSRKLKTSIIKVTDKVKDDPYNYKDYIVYGVTKDEGITLTGNVTSEDLSEYIVVGENTFAFNPYRINIGSIGLSGNNFSGLVSPAYVVFKTNEDLLPEFLFSFLKSDTGIKLINWHGNRGGVRNALRFDDLGEIDIPDLTIEEQIDALKRIDAAKGKLNLVSEELDFQQTHFQQLRQAILQEAVQGKLTKQNKDDEPADKLLQRIKAEKQSLIAAGNLKKEKELLPITEDEIPFTLPNHWQWCRLADLCSLITDGTHKTPIYKDYGIPFISAQNLSFNRINFELKKYITNEEYTKYFKNKRLRTGDVLLAKSGTLGLASVFELNVDYAFYESLALIRPIKYVNPFYISYFLNFNSFRFIKQNQKGIGVKHLHLINIKSFLIPLPPSKEQDLVVHKIEQLMKTVNQLEQQTQQSQSQAEQLLQVVLNEAFSNNGKVFEEKEIRTMAAEN